jgi:hypothetical protein
MLGTLSGGYGGSVRRPGVASPYAGAVGALDPYEVLLTSRRLIALRPRGLVGGISSLALECERQSARAALDKRGLIYDRVQLAFGSTALTLRVHRIFRANTDRIVAALGD